MYFTLMTNKNGNCLFCHINIKLVRILKTLYFQKMKPRPFVSPNKTARKAEYLIFLTKNFKSATLLFVRCPFTHNKT